MKPWIPFMLPLLWLGVMACNQPDERFEQAVEWARQGQYERSDSLFTALLQDDPHNDAALNNRSFVRIQLGHSQAALTDINRAIALDSTTHRYYEVRASAYLELGQPGKAEADILRAIELNGQSAQAYFLLGTLRSIQKKYQAALRALKKSLDLDPSAREPLIQIVGVYVNARQYEKAIYEATKLLDKGILDPLLLNNRGFASMQMDRYDLAKEDFQKALQMDPNYAAARNNLGYARYKLGDTMRGLKLINESLELDPDNAYAYKFRGEVNDARGQRQAACTDWQKALDLDFTAKHDSSVISLLENRCN
jgi:tetratricopeptide (TPR) repeat protein